MGNKPNRKLSYDPIYKGAIPIQNTSSNSQFNYKVINIEESREIQGINYINLITIKVDYNIDSFTNLKRIYTFAEGIGLVWFSVGDNVYVKTS